MQQLQFVATTPQQLRNEFKEDVKSLLDELKKSFQPKEPTEYLTRSEISELLQIDLSTVHNWTKKGILTANQIGGRVYYKRSDIESAMVELKK